MPRPRLTLAAAVLAAWPASAARDGGAMFDLWIGGVPIGSASLSATAANGRYAVQGSADVGFLFWGGAGEARSEGTVGPRGLTPARYDLRYEGVRRPGHVSIAFEDGRAVRWDSAPPPPEQYLRERVAVSPAHLGGVLDPLSALVTPAPADADPQALCRRVLPVFSGYTRFDLELTGASRARDGEVACAARYIPVAGHRPGSPGVERMTRPDAFSITLAPLSEGFWGPRRIAVATRFGDFVATRR